MSGRGCLLFAARCSLVGGASSCRGVRLCSHAIMMSAATDERHAGGHHIGEQNIG